MIIAGDVVLIDKVLRFCWRMRLVEKLSYWADGAVRGAVVTISETGEKISRQVNKLYLIEHI